VQRVPHVTGFWLKAHNFGDIGIVKAPRSEQSMSCNESS